MDIKTAMSIIGLKPAQVQSMTLKDLTSYTVAKRKEVTAKYGDDPEDEELDLLEDELADISDAFVVLKDTFNTVSSDISTTEDVQLPIDFFPREIDTSKIFTTKQTDIPRSEQKQGTDYPTFLGNDTSNPNLAFFIPTKYIPSTGTTSLKGVTENGKIVTTTVRLTD